MNIQPITSRLAIIPFTYEIEKLTKGFVGRDWLLQDVYKWLENKDYSAFLQESSTNLAIRFFILTGETGVGKTTVAAKLIQECDHIKAYHFCQVGRVETTRSSSILRSLAIQLGKKLPDYGQALASTIKPINLRSQVNTPVNSISGSEITQLYIENLKPNDPENEVEILIRSPLVKLEQMYARRGENPPITVILIDSVDEAVTIGDDNILRVLSQLCNSELPNWVRFILTARTEDSILEFEGIKPYHLQTANNFTDIWQYIEKRLEETNIQEALQKTEVPIGTLTSEIAKLANGNFLYIKLLLNHIVIEQQSLEISALPKSIEDIYTKFFQQFPSDEWQNLYQPILGKLAVTQQPLTQQQLENFTDINNEQLQSSLESLQQFLNVEDETYAIFHQSLRNYLFSKSSQRFYCDALLEHNSIIKYYKKDDQSWQDVDWIEADEYGLLHLAKHLNAAGRDEELYTLLTETPNWIEVKYNFFASHAAYIDDLELAINKFTDPLQPNEVRALVKLYTALRLGVSVCS
jgi:hypothetical protein